ncbi:MAG: GTP-binding protein [Planctomycetota bacterium]|jgi:GTP-binding protein
MFRDEAIIDVSAGKGGDGTISFRREKYVQQGGPDGGDGGRGGSVRLRADHHVTSLLRLGRERNYAARGGQPGGPKKCTGKSADDLELIVPIGTQIFDQQHGNLLADLDKDGQVCEVVRGGHGGKGNIHFANSIRQVPNHATAGGEGEKRRLRLELKIFAEVGLVGLPNAGKSTFLARVTAAEPKIADYPFTTLSPQVGIARVHDYDSLVIADLPGLIEGAADGHGLGMQFLKHVERCRILLHLVDVSEGAIPSPAEAFGIIDRELRAYSDEVATKDRLIVATKVESEGAEENAKILEEVIGQPVTRISSVVGQGLEPLLLKLWDHVHGTREPW